MTAAMLALLAGFASLSSLATAGLLYARLRRQGAALRGRLDSVVETHGLARHTPGRAVAGKRARARRGLALSLVARLLGYEAGEPHLYPVKWWLVGLLALAPARLVVWLVGTMLGDVALALLPLAWVMVCRSVFGWMAQRYTQRLLTQFPDALAMIVRAVRAGVPVQAAVQSVAAEAPAETAREFRRGAEQLVLGGSVEDAVAEMARQSRLTEYRFFATALALQAQTGGGLSETLENLADVIRKRVAMRARGNALSSEAKTSAGILAVLPLLTGGALLVISPDYADMLFVDPGGQQLFAVAVGFLCGGILVMRHMIRKSLT